MATTTNYAWETPDDTDLVKDGASAIRTLGSSIDTTTKALNPSTTLGDIEYRSATANTNTRLPIGTSGQVLAVSGGVPSWTTPGSSGAYTLISTASLSGSSTVVSSIPGTYQDLRIVLTNFRTTNDGDNIFFRFNADSTANRHNQSYNEFSPTGAFDGDHATLTGDQDNTAAGGLLVMDIPNYTASTWKIANSLSLFPQYTTATNWKSWQTQPFYNQTTAISSLEFYPRFGTWAAGTISVYGVK
jgi:hypothetical protein